MKRRSLLQGAAAIAAPSILTYARAASKVQVGIPLPVSSVQAEVASELKTGYEIAFARSKALGGVEIVPVFQDDRSVADETAKAVDSFGRDPSILATTGIVGTPHAKAALPIAQRLGLPVVGLRSGAAELRDGKRGVYHLRASYSDELTMMVRMIQAIGLKLAVVYSDDAFGKGCMAHVASVAASLGVPLGQTLPAERNGADIEKVVGQAVRQSEGAGALMLLMIAQPMQRGLRHAREKLNFVNPVFCMSFCATRYLAESKDDYLTGLGLVTAFPLPRVAAGGLGQAFLREAQSAQQAQVISSLTAYEGFMYGSVLAAAIDRAQQPTREAVMRALAQPISLGGERFAFDSSFVGYRYLQIVHKGDKGPLRS